MSRLGFVGLVILQLTGCIIYEDRYHRVPCKDCGADEEPGDDTEPTVVEPTPEPTTDLALTVNEGLVGETLLSTLVATSDPVDLTTVATLEFERDVAILDLIQRPDELVLLLSIAADAEPGPVEVFLTTTNDGGFVLAEPFRIVADGTESDDTGL